MKRTDTQPKAHFFICCRMRDGKPSCAAKGAEAMVKDLKAWAKNEGLKEQIKVSQSSCLGLCEKGITACLYPQNQWFERLEHSDLDQIKELLRESAELSS